jgi:Flp pilus assembly protein TadD
VRCKYRYQAAFVLILPAVISGGVASAQAMPGQAQQSWTQKFGASVKSGAGKLGAMVTPKPPAPGTEIVNGPPKKPSPAVYVALAEMHERNGNIEEAETQLRKALGMNPNHLGALLAYAHLEDRRRDFEEATKYYQKALKKHSKEASVHNDLGLCYHRRGMLTEANKSLSKAVELESHKKLYRDNLAAVLVDQGKPEEALTQLSKAHGEAVGNYNLAYLLVQKHDNQNALQHFRRAAQLDPGLAEAQQWVAQLTAPMGSPYGPPAGAAPMTAGQPAAVVARREPAPAYSPGSIATDRVSPSAYTPPVGPQGYRVPQTNQLPAQPSQNPLRTPVVGGPVR